MKPTPGEHVEFRIKHSYLTGVHWVFRKGVVLAERSAGGYWVASNGEDFPVVEGDISEVYGIPCQHCDKFPGQHADAGKCLFDMTTYEPRRARDYR